MTTSMSADVKLYLNCYLENRLYNKMIAFSLVDRFTGRPGAYLRLINRWKLEEVSHYCFNCKALWVLVFLNLTIAVLYFPTTPDI